MGSFSEIYFDDYPVFETKNDYIKEIIDLIFLENDFICEERKYSTRNKITWGDAYENVKGTFEFKGFRQTVKVCKQRLEIYGINLKNAKIDFLNAKKIANKEGCYNISLKNISFDSYIKEITNIVSSKQKRYDLETNFQEILMSNSLGIFGQSIDCLLYSIMSILPENAIIEYDLTDVIDGGWLTINQVKKIDNEKIIILTEGKTDVEFISKGIEKLFPYLRDYYHFIDFGEYKVKIESNASALVKLTTSFAAAKVKHPIIVLFDNDTTGMKEMRKLTSMDLPFNIRILKYPDIALANKYPTIGPTGTKKMNVNGYACSIEMYFGIDVLSNNNELIPIQWKGFEEGEKKYHGEITEKNYIQEKFRTKLTSDKISETSDFISLLNTIFDAFK